MACWEYSIGTAFINIIADAGAIIYVNGVLQGSGDPVTGTTSYVTYKLTSGFTGDVTITSDKLIRVALINLSGNIIFNMPPPSSAREFPLAVDTISSDEMAFVMSFALSPSSSSPHGAWH